MMDVAKSWLGEAFDLDEKKELKLMALEDSDLQPMWNALQEE